jgi:DNA-binding GntR family transcriptional regulator
MDSNNLRISKQSATLRSLVEDKLRSAIGSGYFKPGQRLVERELCDMLGVGRTSVREALRQLEAEGLVDTFPNRGPVVSETNYADTQQLYDIRSLVEGFAGEQFAVNASNQQIAQLEAIVKAFEKAARNPRRDELVGLKAQFYDCLMEGSGNKFARQFLTLLHNRINMLRATSMVQPGRLEHSVAELKEIIDAVRARDAERAGQACRDHINAAAAAALSVLQSNREPGPD